MSADETDRETRDALLAEENRRLREQLAASRRTRYRRTARALGVLGVLAVLGGLVLPDGRSVLFALGGIGLFAGVLTYYLTPERFVPASVGASVYGAMAANAESMRETLGLRETAIYLPPDADRPARLFVPRHPDPTLPEGDGPFAIPENARGLVLEPTGARLHEQFRTTATEPAPENFGPLARQLAEGVVASLELAESADPSVEADGERVTVSVTGSAFGGLDQFDHPVTSFLAVGLVTALEEPVTVAVTHGDEAAEWLVTFRRFEDAD